MIRRLKRASSLFLVLLASSLGALAVEDSTDPVGVYKFQVQQGTNLFVPGLVTRKEFQGELTAAPVTAPDGTLVVADAQWTPGAFNETASYPTHYAEIVEPGHPSEGFLLDIVSNTADTLTVAIGGLPFQQLGLAGTETICIRAHTTLASIFKNATIGNFSDFVIVYNDDGTNTTYIYDGADWLDLSTFAPASNRCIYPGQGIVFLSEANKDLVIGGDDLGYVKMSPTRVNAYSNALNLVGQVNPLTTTGGQLGDLALPGTLAPFADFIQIYSAQGSDLVLTGSYVSDGAQMLDLATFLPADAVPVEFGTGISIIPGDDISVLLPSGF